MFQILKNFITYFLILSIWRCTCKPTPNDEEYEYDYECKTTVNYEKKVEEELILFQPLIEKIKSNTVKRTLEGMFKVKLGLLVKYRMKTEKLLGDCAILKKEKQILSRALWYARIRSAIEKFEDDLARNADIEFPKPTEEKDTNIRRHIFTERKWQWIFKNKGNDDRVKTLVDKINASKDITSTDAFSKLIARAFSELSDYINQELLRPGISNFNAKFGTTDPKVKCAFELFMDLFVIRNIIDVRKNG